MKTETNTAKYLTRCSKGSLKIKKSTVVNNANYLLKSITPHWLHCECVPTKIRTCFLVALEPASSSDSFLLS